MIYSVGSIFLDHIIKINSFPKKPIKVIAEGIEKRLGGSAAVASFTIKKLGIDSSFIGRLGDSVTFIEHIYTSLNFSPIYRRNYIIR